jgi:hypothetical protein
MLGKYLLAPSYLFSLSLVKFSLKDINSSTLPKFYLALCTIYVALPMSLHMTGRPVVPASLYLGTRNIVSTAILDIIETVLNPSGEETTRGSKT